MLGNPFGIELGSSRYSAQDHLHGPASAVLLGGEAQKGERFRRPHHVVFDDRLLLDGAMIVIVVVALIDAGYS